METKPYLLFSLNSSLYAVEAFLVQEIFFLPELTPVAEAPREIVGVVNLRGEILPVMDVNLRLRQRSPHYKLTDSVIVLASEGVRVGIVVNQVHQVDNISSGEITTQLSYGREVKSANNAQFIAGIAQVGSDIVALLNFQNLIEYVDIQDITPVQGFFNNNVAADEDDIQPSDNGTLKQRVFCPNATPEERAVFQERAENLMRLSENQDFSGLLPLAIIGLDNEFFGLDLKTVREFTDIRKITPVPCCPRHIVGNMNLRGEILTLVDIRGLLNLEIALPGSASKAMVLHVDDLVLGVTIDDVFDVMYLNPKDMMAVPTAVHSINNEYLRGTAIYQEKLMGILEMSKILRHGDLIVDEEV